MVAVADLARFRTDRAVGWCDTRQGVYKRTDPFEGVVDSFNMAFVVTEEE